MEGGQAVIGTNVSICDGKYIIIQAPTGTTRVLRYGEEWRDVTGDNVIGGLAWELQEARERIKRLEEAGNNLLWNFCPEYTSDFTESQSDALKQWNKAKEVKP
jgi:uncharacterized heparinase superfamily protein